jgi:hypothetical protein
MHTIYTSGLSAHCGGIGGGQPVLDAIAEDVVVEIATSCLALMPFGAASTAGRSAKMMEAFMFDIGVVIMTMVERAKLW